MRRLTAIIALLCPFLMQASAQNTHLKSSFQPVETTQPTQQILICFGDSITEKGQWLDSLQFPDGWTLVNAGRSGRKAADIPAEFPPVLGAHPEATGLLIMLGVNDLPARDPRPDDEKVAAALAHIQWALDQALDHFHPEAIILVAPPNIDAEGLDSVNIGKGYAIVPPMLKQLEAGLEPMARAHGVHFISLQDTLGPEHFSDGLHPNAEGDAVIAQALKNALPQPRPEFLNGPLPAIYVVGDSISIDYHEALEATCQGAYRYSRKGGIELARTNLDHPQGANGGDSAAVLKHVRDVLQKPDEVADTLLINCGLHDIKVDTTTGKNQVSLDAYRDHLAEIADRIQIAGKRLVWLTTTPLDEARHNARSKAFHRFEADLANYNAAAVEVMTAKGVPVIDLHAFTEALEAPLFRDHVHFFPEVSQRQAEFIRASLDKLEWLGPAAPLSAFLKETIAKQIIIEAIDTDQAVVALTFDDGPHPTQTQHLLDLLAQEDIRMTFFELGKNVAEHPELARAILAAGHEIGNHSKTHPRLGEMEDIAAVRAELAETQAIIKEATGFTPVIFRAPYISHGPALWTVLNELKLPTIGGAQSAQDWDASVSMEGVIENSVRAGAGDIVILHTWPKKTAGALPEIIRQLKAKGLRFVTVSELLALTPTGS